MQLTLHKARCSLHRQSSSDAGYPHEGRALSIPLTAYADAHTVKGALPLACSKGYPYHGHPLHKATPQEGHPLDSCAVLMTLASNG